MLSKPHIQLGCLVEGGFILSQIKRKFIRGDIIRSNMVQHYSENVNQIRLQHSLYLLPKISNIMGQGLWLRSWTISEVFSFRSVIEVDIQICFAVSIRHGEYSTWSLNIHPRSYELDTSYKKYSVTLN